MMIKSILFANSGKGQAQDMIKSLSRLPAFSEVKIYILFVITQQITVYAEQQNYAKGERILKQAVEDLKLPPERVETLLRPGEPKDVIREVADELNVDLILMGSRGMGRLKAVIGNSASQYVFQAADRPLLLVRDNVYPRILKRIMVAVDQSEEAQQSLEFAISTLRYYDRCELVLLRVNKKAGEAKQLTRMEMADDPALAVAAQRVRQMGVKKFRAILTGGRPGQKICDVAEDEKIDLVFIGSPDLRPSVGQSLPDFDRLFGDSVSDYVRVNAPCPVFIARGKSE